jgi:hypothetical protein
VCDEQVAAHIAADDNDESLPVAGEDALVTLLVAQRPAFVGEFGGEIGKENAISHRRLQNGKP